MIYTFSIDTFVGLYRDFWFILVLPVMFSYIIIEIVFHSFINAIKGKTDV